MKSMMTMRIYLKSQSMFQMIRLEIYGILKVISAPWMAHMHNHVDPHQESNLEAEMN